MESSEPITGRPPKPARPRRKWGRFAISVAAVFLTLYAACGFWLAPYLIKRMLPQIMAEQLKLTAAVERVSINPFTFSTRLSGFNAELPESTPLLSFAELYVNINPWSVIGAGYHIQEVNLQGLNGNIVRQADGRFNFETLLTERSAPSVQGPTEPRLPEFSVDRLTISDGRLEFTDLSRPAPFNTQVHPIHLEVTDFSTRIEAENSFALKAKLAQGGAVNVEGRFSATSLGSEGRVQVSRFPLASGWEYIQDRVRFEIVEGTTDLTVPYIVSLEDAGLDVVVKNASLALTGLKVAEKGRGPDPVVVVPSLSVKGLSANLKEQSLQVDSIITRDGWVKGWLTPDGELGLASVLALEPFEGREKFVSEIKKTETVLEHEWQVAVKQVLLADSAVDYEDRTLSPPFRLQLKPIRIELKQLTNRQNHKAELNMSVKDAAGGMVSVSGYTSIHSSAADLNIRIDNIALTQFEPYLSEIDHLKLKSGSLHSDFNLKMIEKQTAEEPKLRLNGRLGIKDLSAADATSGGEIFRLKALDIGGIEFQEQPNRLNVAEIAIKQPATNVIIYPDGRINVSEVMKPKPGAKEKIKKSLLGRIANAVRLQIQGPVPFKIERIALEGGRAGITDQSIEPVVSLELQPYGLNVTRLDSIDTAPATADLSGSLGGGADLKVDGRFNPFRKDQPTEMNVSLDNFDLTNISPYAGRFAGYGIDKGQLSLGMNYTISQKLVDGSNKIHLKQLTLGERTDSPDAIDLPLELAIALLKDRKGNIDLNLPLQGNLDDPQFQIGGVITRTLISLISSVVTSPFSVLSGIAGAFSAEDLQHIEFEPGKTVLDPNETAKLNTLAQALQERPALILQVKATAVSSLDGTALARQALAERIETLSPKAKKSAGITDAGSDQHIDPNSEAYLRGLVVLYQQRFKRLPEGFDESDSAAIRRIETVLLDEVEVENEALLRLARLRAQRIQNFLLQEGSIDPGRLLMVAADIIDQAEGDRRVKTTLSVTP